MAEKPYSNWKPSLPPCVRRRIPAARGATLVELLVVLVVGGLLTGATLTLTLATRRGYEKDQARTRMNQNLRAALDLIGIEIRQAGERLPADVPALEIHDGVDGAADELVIRRNLLDAVLPLCEELTSGALDDEVRVAQDGVNPPLGCTPLPDTDANGFADNIDSWRVHRDSNGGAADAYVYNPIERAGEYFRFDGDGTTDATFIGKGNDTPWSRDYGINQQCRIYMLEQRTYRLDAGRLLFALNAAGNDDVHVSTGLIDMQITAVLADGSSVDSLLADDEWTGIAGIEVTLTGTETVDGESRARTMSARFFPRNVLSH